MAPFLSQRTQERPAFRKQKRQVAVELENIKADELPHCIINTLRDAERGAGATPPYLSLTLSPAEPVSTVSMSSSSDVLPLRFCAGLVR